MHTTSPSKHCTHYTTLHYTYTYTHTHITHKATTTTTINVSCSYKLAETASETELKLRKINKYETKTLTHILTHTLTYTVEEKTLTSLLFCVYFMCSLCVSRGLRHFVQQL